MSNDSVYIRELAIHRVAGIRRGEGFLLEGLSPGINIIFGPNGAGKSTTCRVIQELLWPGELERPAVEGIVVDRDGEWRVEIDSGHVQYLRDGRPGSSPDWGPVESRARYHLGLKQFITGDNAEFAARIAQATQGGYDLDAAADALKYSRHPTAPRDYSRLLQKEEQTILEAIAAQRDMDEEAGSLSVLKAELDESAAAERRLMILKKVRDYQLTVERCRQIEAERDAFPEGVGLLRGDEEERLSLLATKEASLRRQLDDEQERLCSATAELRELRLQEDGIPDEHIRTLRARKKELSELESKFAEQRRRRDEAAGTVESALRHLGDAFTEEHLAGMATLENADLSELARRAARVRAERESLYARKAWLEAEVPEDIQSINDDQLTEGIHTLANWLASAGDNSRETSWKLIVSAALIVALIAVLAFSQQWIGVVLAVLAGVFFGLEWWLSKVSSDRETHEKGYQNLSLPTPDAWDAGAVSQHLRHLSRLQGKKVLAAERRSRLEDLKPIFEAFYRQEAALDVQRAELERKLGCRIELTDEWLPVLVGRIADWQSATACLDAAAGALEALESDRQWLLDRINVSLAAYCDMKADSAATAEEATADLESRRQKHAATTKSIHDAARLIRERIQPGLEEIDTERAAIFDRLKIGASDRALIADWMARREDYLRCVENLNGELRLRDDTHAALDTHEELLELEPSELERQILESEAVAARRDGLSRRMGGIQRSIDSAKTGHTLADALAARDDAQDRLARAREDNGRARVGAALTEWVRRVAIDRARPRVFQRADELFARFTRGTLHLRMDDRATPPAFVAQRGKLPLQSLNQLSDGERVQLMTAVRLAFLEQDETTPLPLLVDEVLGTSDDGRSEVIIDAVIDVARQGRQVFYCTAQHDEVGKWVARLEQEGIAYTLHDLAQIRELAAARTNPLKIVRIVKSLPPLPTGLTYDEYGRELGVPGIDPRAETIDGVHLWYLFEDAEILYRLLLKDISTWGQLETLLDRGGAGLIDAGESAFDTARIAARAVDEACRAWRVGRGRPVDRAALLDSNCVTETFIDDVSALALRSKGNAREILDALVRGDVKKFRSNKTDDLREFFEAEGFLPLQEPLDPEEIRLRVMASVATELRNGFLGENLVDRIRSSIAPASARNGMAA